jgi:NADH dehydrogenase FAD-containing subunit
VGDAEAAPMDVDSENVPPTTQSANVNGEVGTNGLREVNGQLPEKEKEKKKKLKLSFEEYKAIANLLVIHLRFVVICRVV